MSLRGLRWSLFPALLLLAACGAPAHTEPAEQRTIAVLRAVEAPDEQPERHLRAELDAAGFVEGVNLRVVPRDGRAYPRPADAEAAVTAWRRDGVDLIVALSSSGAAAAHRAAPDVPVLFVSNDPKATGLVEDEQEPEGHLTGVTFRVPADRTLTLSGRVLPDLDVLGLAYPPADPAAIAHRDAVSAAADSLGVKVATEEFRDADDVATAVERLLERGVDALLLSTSPTAVAALDATAAAVQGGSRIPVIANTHLADFALVALYPDNNEVQRQLGRQAVRLLAGSTPSAVPVEDPRRFLVRLNATLAADLGLEITDDVLREANEVVTE